MKYINVFSVIQYDYEIQNTKLSFNQLDIYNCILIKSRIYFQ